jgi:hypothetical protein
MRCVIAPACSGRRRWRELVLIALKNRLICYVF